MSPLLREGYRRLLRPVLFRSGGGDPELAHEQTLAALSRLSTRPGLARGLRRVLGAVEDPVEIAGIRFANRVGLAAGVDKRGIAVNAWQGLGFGHVELGTVTAHGQPGNPTPRVFRAVASGGLVNRMGFNNEGATAMAARLAAAGVWRGGDVAGLAVGISLGKTKATPLGAAVEDYLDAFAVLHPHADYVAVNVSSPNTPGLRDLQDATLLRELTAALTEAARQADAAAPVPVFVKLSPDLSEAALDQAIEVCEESGVSALIAANTTLSRDGLAPDDSGLAAEAGGLSGAPLTERARAVVARVAEQSRLPVIGVGGVMAPADAQALFDAGAAMVQLYTGFIYAGPALVTSIRARHHTSIRSELPR